MEKQYSDAAISVFNEKKERLKSQVEEFIKFLQPEEGYELEYNGDIEEYVYGVLPKAILSDNDKVHTFFYDDSNENIKVKMEIYFDLSSVLNPLEKADYIEEEINIKID